MGLHHRPQRKGAAMRWNLASAQWWYRVPATGSRLRAGIDSAARAIRPAGLETVDHLNDHQLRDIGLWREANGRVGASGSGETE
jgi:hypothetical protein